MTTQKQLIQISLNQMKSSNLQQSRSDFLDERSCLLIRQPGHDGLFGHVLVVNVGNSVLEVNHGRKRVEAVALGVLGRVQLDHEDVKSLCVVVNALHLVDKFLILNFKNFNLDHESLTCRNKCVLKWTWLQLSINMKKAIGTKCFIGIESKKTHLIWC